VIVTLSPGFSVLDFSRANEVRRARQLEIPDDLLRVGDLDPRMRVLPAELLDNTGHRDRLLRFERGRRMMRERRCHKRDDQRRRNEQPSH
jgi:hypothetical protein